MVALEAEVRGGIKAKPVRPRPRPVAKGKKTSSTDITDGMISITLRIETDIDTHQMVKPLVLTQNLPVPADSKWVKAFLSTALLWAGSQANPWEISESLMADALQEIFDVVYPDVKYKVNPNGAVFAAVSS
jgi:hypothetical protein